MAANFVLVHSPLVGPLTWRAVAAELRQRGHVVDVTGWPSLSAIPEPFYPGLTDALATVLSGLEEPQIIVAHSAAGALMPELVARFWPPVSGVIFADAILPHPGRSWFDTAPQEMRERLRAGAQMGELPSWDQWWPPGALERLAPDAGVRESLMVDLGPLPLAYFEETAPATTLAVPQAYLQLSGAYDDESQVAARYGWPLVRLPLHHLAMLTHPQAVAVALESLAERLEAPANG